jgi:hypothetical protein
VFRRFAAFLAVWCVDVGGFLFLPWMQNEALLCVYRKTRLLAS